MQRLKLLRAIYIERIATLKQLFEESLTRLETVLEHHSATEKDMFQQFLDKHFLEFKYDPNLEIEQTNLELGRTVAAYLVSKDRKVDEERIMADITATSENIGGLLHSLAKSVR